MKSPALRCYEELEAAALSVEDINDELAEQIRVIMDGLWAKRLSSEERRQMNSRDSVKPLLLPIPPLTLSEARILAETSIAAWAFWKDDHSAPTLTVVRTAEGLRELGYLERGGLDSRGFWQRYQVTPDGYEALKQMFEWAMLHRLVLTT